MNLVYVCPKCGLQAHHAGTCPKHKVALEKRCAHCGNPPEHCICN